MAHDASRRARPGLSWPLAGLPEPSQGSPGWPGGPRGGTNHLSHQTAGLTRTGAIGSQLLSNGVSAVEQTVPVRRWRISFRPQRRFDRSMGPSESQRAVPKSVRLARPCCSPRKKASHRNRKGNEFRNGTGTDAVCSVPRTASATCADLVDRCRRRWCDPDGCVGR